jgi:hypothetical protein
MPCRGGYTGITETQSWRDSMLVEKTFQGAWRISGIVGDRFRSAQYFDYAREEALAEFILDHGGTLADGEVLGLDNDGCVIQWNAEEEATYNSGETPEQFGRDNFTEAELERITLA